MGWILCARFEFAFVRKRFLLEARVLLRSFCGTALGAMSLLQRAIASNSHAYLRLLDAPLRSASVTATLYLRIGCKSALVRKFHGGHMIPIKTLHMDLMFQQPHVYSSAVSVQFCRVWFWESFGDGKGYMLLTYCRLIRKQLSCRKIMMFQPISYRQPVICIRSLSISVCLSFFPSLLPDPSLPPALSLSSS
jgi:hypothetical protein